MMAGIYGGAEEMLGVKNWLRAVCAYIFPTEVLYKYNTALDHVVIPLRATTICCSWMSAFTKDLNVLWHIHNGFIPSSDFLCFPMCLQTDNPSLKKWYDWYFKCDTSLPSNTWQILPLLHWAVPNSESCPTICHWNYSLSKLLCR